ncbi:MAG: UvrD-helicase domain-containing protein [Mycoplasmatales bacterium]
MAKFTTNQLLGINQEGTNLLISAGAGSGKTTVLTQRIIRKLLNGTSIDNLLVLTFTNAAAAEMKERIKLELQNHNKLTKQLALIESANITTFDAYLLTLVEKYGYLLDLKSGITIGDSVFLEKLLVEVIDTEFNNLYEQVSQEQNLDPAIGQFLDNYFVFDDAILQNNFKILYYKYKNILNKEEFEQTILQEQIELYFQQYETYLFAILTAIKKNLQKLTNIPTCPKGEKVVSTFLQKYDFINLIQKYDDFVLFFTEAKTVAKTRAEIENKELINLIQEEINQNCKLLKAKLVFKTKENILRQENHLLPIKKVIIRLLEKIDQLFFAKKKTYNLFDFSDITYLALEILNNKTIKTIIKNSFVEILIDEYQDTNDFQNHFIDLIANNNLYLVGDVKQSIYEFRNANPQNFNKLQKTYYEDKQVGEVINLTDNFRSRKEVLQSVNLIFEQLMHKENSDIDYSMNHALNYGNKTYDVKQDNHNYMLEILTYNLEYFQETLALKDLPNYYYEPLIIVNDILTKINTQHQVLDQQELRKIEFKDFVILTKTKATYAYYQEVFEYFNIPLNTQVEQYINNQQNLEILALINILKLIKNPKNKILQVNILKSFLYELTNQEIYDYIKYDYKLPQINHLKTNILSLKSLHINNLTLLITEIFERFNFIEKMVLLPNIIGVNERLVKVMQICESFTTLGKSPTELIDYLTYSLETTSQKLEIEQVLPSANNVSLMTIHKSKGLEYNIVYLPDLNKSLYQTDKINLDLNKTYGLIIPTIKDYQKEDSFLKNLAKFQHHENLVNENIRLLYVAMTRAKEQIIFINNEEKAQKSSATLTNYESIKKFSDLINCLSEITNPYHKEITKLDRVNVMDFIKNLDNKTLNYEQKSNNQLKSNYYYNTVKIQKEEKVKANFSKDKQGLLTTKQQESIILGNYLHNQLETINIKKLTNSKYQEHFLSTLTANKYQQNLLKKIILNLAKLDFVIQAKNYWTEYEFYFEQENQQMVGIIDLLIETTDKVYIIDYKLNDITDEAYKKQILGYKAVISEYFTKEITCYLYSLLQNELKEIHD